jgi:DNA primase
MEIQPYIEDIKTKINIVDYIGKFVALKKAGRNFTGLCPFHIEKTPSFSVSPDKNIFFCFGCRTGGDVVAFVTKFEGLTFKEAVEHLGALAGLPPVVWNDGKKSADNQDMYELMKITSDFFQLSLQKEKLAMDYFSKRGISQETIDRFNLGYAPPNSELLLNLLTDHKIDYTRAAYLGILSRDTAGNYYSYFRDRVIFPIHNLRGSVIGFGGRSLSEQQMPKYLNSPDNSIFHKGKNLYAFYEGRSAIAKACSVILVEGYMDTISLHQKGIQNTVASLGTAFSMEQAEMIHKHVPTIYFCYDNDLAGKKATIRALELLMPTDVPCRVIEIPGTYKDPDEYIQKTNIESFQKSVENAKPSLDYLWDQIKTSIKPEDSLSLNDGLDKMIHYLSHVNNNILRETLLRKIALDVNLKPDNLQIRMQALKRGEVLYKSAYQNKKTTNKGNIPDLNGERILLKALLEQPDTYLDIIFNEIEESDFSEPLHQKLFLKIRENYQQLGYIQLRDLYDRIDEKDLYALISELMMIDNSFIEKGKMEVFLLNETNIHQLLNSTRNTRRRKHIVLLRSRISKAEKEGDFETSRILIEELKKNVG